MSNLALVTKTAEQRELQTYSERAIRLASNLERDGYELAQVCLHVKKAALWKAGGYKNFGAWRDAVIEHKARQVTKYMRVACEFSEEQVKTVGVEKAARLLKLPEPARVPMLVDIARERLTVPQVEQRVDVELLARGLLPERKPRASLKPAAPRRVALRKGRAVIEMGGRQVVIRVDPAGAWVEVEVPEEAGCE